MSLALQLWLPLLAISRIIVVTDGDGEADKYDYIRVMQQMHNEDATDEEGEADRVVQMHNVWVQPHLHICTVPSPFANCRAQKYIYFEVFAYDNLDIFDCCRAPAYLHIVVNLKRWQI